MTYEQTLDFLHTQHTSIYKGLTRIRYVLDKLGNPQDTFPSVLITGTNGKGSTAKIISTILKEAGYRVGCFTSPHLMDFAERIMVNEKPISHEDVIKLTEEIRRGPLEDLEKERDVLHIEGLVCFFEIVTAMAFLYFARQKVDIAILEVGIGGRLDATNTVNPLVSVITNIGLDHQEFLGDTIEEIAKEKAGIIRNNGDVVIGSRNPEALGVIEAICRQKNATLYKTGVQDVMSSQNAKLSDESACFVPAIRSIPQKISSSGSFFSYQGIHCHCDDLYIHLAGIHQLANAAVALSTLEILYQKGFHFDERNIRVGLSQLLYPGRLETIHTKPTFVVDIAHNAMGAKVVANALTAIFDYHKLIIIIGVLHDKDVDGILRPFLEIANSMIFTSPHNTNRAETAATTARIAESLVKNLSFGYSKNEAHLSRFDHWLIYESVETAIQQGHVIAGKSDVICVTGSNYTVSEAEMIYKRQYILRNK